VQKQASTVIITLKNITLNTSGEYKCYIGHRNTVTNEQGEISSNYYLIDVEERDSFENYI